MSLNDVPHSKNTYEPDINYARLQVVSYFNNNNTTTLFEVLGFTLIDWLIGETANQISSIRKMLVFSGRGKPEHPRKKLLWEQSREPTTSPCPSTSNGPGPGLRDKVEFLSCHVICILKKIRLFDICKGSDIRPFSAGVSITVIKLFLTYLFFLAWWILTTDMIKYPRSENTTVMRSWSEGRNTSCY